MITRTKVLILTLACTGLTVHPASAQQVSSHAMSKSKWYNAPREIQITDDRPVVKDFREGPQSPAGFDLPPGPGSGPFGGNGAGALGGGDPSGVLPGNGLPIGGGGPAYRTGNGGSLPLPRADFAHSGSNIPARGMGPAGVLPNGTTTGIHGKVSPYSTVRPVATGPSMSRPYASRQSPVQRAATYNPGGGYGAITPSYGGGGANTAVSGKLMTNLLKKQR